MYCGSLQVFVNAMAKLPTWWGSVHKSRWSRGAHMRRTLHPRFGMRAGEPPVGGPPHVRGSPRPEVGGARKSRGHTHGAVPLVGVRRGVIGDQPWAAVELVARGVLVPGALCRTKKERKKEEQLLANLVPRPPSQTLTRSRGEKSIPRPPSQTLTRSRGEKLIFLHGCEIKSGRDAWVRG